MKKSLYSNGLMNVKETRVFIYTKFTPIKQFEKVTTLSISIYQTECTLFMFSYSIPIHSH